MILPTLVSELIDGLLIVIYAEYPKPDFNAMISTATRLLDEYDITFECRSRVFVNGNNPSFIIALKDRVDEDPQYDKRLEYYKHTYPSLYDLQFLQQNKFVISVTFNEEHKHMLAYCKKG